jgi:hypothetical protein
MAPAITTSLRLARELLDRADALVPHLGAHGQALASGQVVRSDVLRIALVRGLESLEAEAARAGNAKKANARRR